MAPAGQVPIPFRIAYDPARIDPAHSYAVRARILVDGRLWFATVDAHRVLTRGQGDEVELLLRRVSQSDERALPGALGTLPATFAGDLPCADCPGIRYQLRRILEGSFPNLAVLSYSEIANGVNVKAAGTVVVSESNEGGKE